MTNTWNAINISDCILAIGSNPAENHPAAFGHITEAKKRGAKLISVDPRFTRTSARADIYALMRSGTDIAFINGMIKYVLDDIALNPESCNMTYITEYTTAPCLINPDFKGPDELDGLFSGYLGSLNETDSAKRKYDASTWQYHMDENDIPKKDRALTDQNCVFQIMKRHFARYTPEMVSAICGTPKEIFLETCRTFAATGQVGKAGTVLYAMGTTQHTYGSQNIRAYAILQLLLGQYWCRWRWHPGYKRRVQRPGLNRPCPTGCLYHHELASLPTIRIPVPVVATVSMPVLSMCLALRAT